MQAVSRKDLMSPDKAFIFTFSMASPPEAVGLYSTNSSGLISMSPYSQDLALLVILETSNSLRSTEWVLNHIFEKQYVH